MDQKKEIQEKIKEILAMQDPQLMVDAIKIIENANIADKEKAMELLRKHLINRNMERYPITEEQRKLEQKKYSLEIRQELQKQQIEKQRQQRKMQQALQAYEKQGKVNSSTESLLSKKDIFQRVEEVVNKIGDIIETGAKEKKEDLRKRLKRNLRLSEKSPIEPTEEIENDEKEEER